MRLLLVLPALMVGLASGTASAQDFDDRPPPPRFRDGGWGPPPPPPPYWHHHRHRWRDVDDVDAPPPPPPWHRHRDWDDEPPPRW